MECTREIQGSKLPVATILIGQKYMYQANNIEVEQCAGTKVLTNYVMEWYTTGSRVQSISRG